jgi:pimeloyl-ACP methyl ester carboxylesterase
VAGPDLGSLRIGDAKFVYRESGTGMPVVLIHGLAQDSRSWAYQQAAIARTCRCVAIDLRGHGASTLGNADGTVRQLGDDIIGALEWIGEPVRLVGFSFGGVVALDVASRRPDLLDRLMLLATSAVVGRAAAESFTEVAELPADTLAAELPGLIRESTVLALRLHPELLDKVVDERLRAARDGRGYANAVGAIAHLRIAPLIDRLPLIERPVEIVGAAEDPFCPPRAAEIMLGALPSAHYRVLPRSGHLMMYDAPEALTEMILGWVYDGDRRVERVDRGSAVFTDDEHLDEPGQHP